MNILIVDDEPMILQGILDGVQWELLDFRRVWTAKNCEQAQKIIEEYHVDILLTDIEMTDQSGLDLIRWVNQKKPGTKCIILSCHDKFDFARQAVQLDCFDYVLKPVPYETLSKILRKAQKRIQSERGQSMLEKYGKEYVKKMGETPDQEDALTLAEEYIQAHICDDIPAELLAKEAHVSPRHLNRLFQKAHGKAATEYITEQRMMLAGELLRETDMSVTLVSDRTGYSNYSYFIKQFKRFYGMTPKEYQQAKRDAVLHKNQ